ncbi:glycoside hydrolase family 5 protein [Rhizoctonia solani 123E]|uniref:Glycoside hydrolase family 5 protein n=1 Tax=Rhizoctonia solani 123E TaxID=1423351 RepID=A0A074SGN1_9AGAM|nr:glycoside hydrolase family 5 protein [Rhizoctonia solani 123E]
MRLSTVTLGAGLLGATSVAAAKKGLPVDKVYGVNLGSWLLAEPWMFPKEWVERMGGDSCDDCSQCAASEFDLVKKLGQDRADQVFKEHWSTWFKQEDVDAIANAGLNTVRIPLGYWIVEDLVDRQTEFYPRGGLEYLKKGLRMLKQKGIHVLLDFHAMPGVAAVKQMFAGRCTADVQFYTEKNYERALTWAAIMTNMIYQDPDFSTVFAIEAVNEPVMDASKTPGYGDYQKRFVRVVRQVENSLGVQCSGDGPIKTAPSPTEADDVVIKRVLERSSSIMRNIDSRHGPGSCQPSTGIKLPITFDEGEIEAIRLGHGAGRLPMPMSASGAAAFIHSEHTRHIPRGSGLEGHNTPRRHHRKRGISTTLADRSCLMTTFMSKDWQYNNPPNPADAANGPQLYDAHLYFSFGGVADPNAESYMRTICNTDRVTKAYGENNNPLVFGEWSLATNFDNSEEFLYDWADAQRHIYAGQADGWIFWSWKIEEGSPYLTQWSYGEGVKRGYFKKDPSQLTNPNVCNNWIANSNSTSS